jgi:hypothetical protein
VNRVLHRPQGRQVQVLLDAAQALFEFANDHAAADNGRMLVDNRPAQSDDFFAEFFAHDDQV